MTARIHLAGMAVMLALAANTVVAAPPLVDGDWLEKRLGRSGIVVVDMTEHDIQYQRYHLPGAVRLAYSQLVKKRPRDGVPVRLPDHELFALLGNLGIERGTHVVIYDDVGGLDAGRLFWELERIGHPAVSVLDGGLVEWVLRGRKVDNAQVTPAPARYLAGTAPPSNEASLADVKQAVTNKSAVLLDVRSEEEYLGSGKSRSGHLPGARFWPWEQAVDFTQGFTLASAEVLEKSLAQAGVERKDTPVLLYCRSGHRAAQTYWALRALGYTRVKLYANSMNEYLLDRDAALKTGKEP